MTWKIGDKVRLTGKMWPELKSPMARGSEHTITRVNSQGSVRLSGYSGCSYWILSPGFEIELVEREEETMSVDFSEVNVGDKVRLTRENGDEATFTVTATSPKRLESEWNTYWVGADGATLEIVERAFKPVPGLYSNGRESVMVTEKMEVYFHSLTWIPANPDAKGTVTYDAVREKGNWGRVVTF